MPIVDNATAFFGYMQQHQLLLALLSGLTLPFIVPLSGMNTKKHQYGSVLLSAFHSYALFLAQYHQLPLTYFAFYTRQDWK